jgi:hypothetical protein
MRVGADVCMDRRFRTMEAAATKLQKEAKGYLDALRGWSLLLFFYFFLKEGC